MQSLIRKSGMGIISIAALLGSPDVPAAGPTDGSGWFVEVGIGSASSSTESGAYVVDGNEDSWSAGVGYSINRYLSLQVAYHDLGHGHFATDCPPPRVCLIANEDRVDIDGIAVSATGSFPITDAIDVFGRVGVMSWDADFDVAANDASDEDVVYGIGVGYSFADTWRITVQYEDYGFDVDSTTVGISHRFGRR